MASMTHGKHLSAAEIALRSAYALVGVAVIGLGAAIMLDGGVGVDPFTALNTGISDLIGWSLGTWQLLANAILIVAVVIWGRGYIGVGTVINMVLTGYFITWFSALLDPVIPDDLGLGGKALFFLLGIAVFDFGASAYMSAGVGTAPYDAIAPMIVDKSRFSYRWVRTIQDIITVTAAWLCHGPVGGGHLRHGLLQRPADPGLLHQDQRAAGGSAGAPAAGADAQRRAPRGPHGGLSRPTSPPRPTPPGRVLSRRLRRRRLRADGARSGGPGPLQRRRAFPMSAPRDRRRFPMTQYAAVVTFPEDATAYQALSELRGSSLSSLVRSTALVERDEQGRLRVPEGDDPGIGSGTAGGSLIGMMIGVLGGPLGMIFGLGTGAMLGGLFDLDRAQSADSALEELGRTVQPGRNALVLETDEPDTAALDAFVAERGGSIVRRPTDEVVAEMESQQAAAEAAAEAARRQLRESRRAERREKFEDRVESLRSRFRSA